MRISRPKYDWLHSPRFYTNCCVLCVKRVYDITMKQSRYTYCTDVTSEQPSMYPTEGEQAGDIR